MASSSASVGSTIKGTLASRKKEVGLKAAFYRFGSSDPLTLAKKEAQLFAKNPKRFLEKRETLRRTDTSSLRALLEGVAEGEGRRGDRALQLQKEARLSKTRTLLLNVTSAQDQRDLLRGGGVRGLPLGLRTRSLSAGGTSISTETAPASEITTRTHPDDFSFSYTAGRRASAADAGKGRQLFVPTPTSTQKDSPRASRSNDSKPPKGPLPSPKTSNKRIEEEAKRKRQLTSKWLSSLNTDEDEEESEASEGRSLAEGYYDPSLNKRNESEVEAAMKAFVDRIKHEHVHQILRWINTLATTKQSSALPYGLPAELEVPLRPESVKEEELRAFLESSFDEFTLLDAEYAAKLEEVGKKLGENWASLQACRWTSKESALLFYIITALEESPAQKFKAQLLKKLFPNFAPEQVTMQKYRLRMKRAWEEKRTAIIKSWVRDRVELTQRINEGWKEVQQHLTEKTQHRADRRRQLELCRYWRDQVNNLRSLKASKIRRLEMMVEPFERETEMRERLRQEEEARRRDHQARAVSQYHDRLVNKQEEIEREKEKIQAEIDANAREQKKYNEQRVLLRQREWDSKVKERAALERLKREERALKRALLEKTKKRVEFNYDPASILADTHSSMLRRHDISTFDDDEEMADIFRDKYGHTFTSEAVLRDRRLRLGEKLREAGLLNSSYARQVLLAMEPKPRPHLTSHLEFKDASSTTIQ